MIYKTKNGESKATLVWWQDKWQTSSELSKQYKKSRNWVMARVRRGISLDYVVQKAGRRTKKHYIIDGEKLSCREISNRYGLKLTCVHRRAKEGKRGDELIAPAKNDKRGENSKNSGNEAWLEMRGRNEQLPHEHRLCNMDRNGRYEQCKRYHQFPIMDEDYRNCWGRKFHKLDGSCRVEP